MYEVLFKTLPVAGLVLKCWPLYKLKLVVYFQLASHSPTSNKSVACPRQDSMSPGWNWSREIVNKLARYAFQACDHEVGASVSSSSLAVVALLHPD